MTGVKTIARPDDFKSFWLARVRLTELYSPQVLY